MTIRRAYNNHAPTTETIDLTLGRLDLQEDDGIRIFIDVEDDDGDDDREPETLRQTTPAPSSDLPFGHVELTATLFGGTGTLRSGVDVQLHDGAFMRIYRVCRDLTTDQDYIQGVLLRRTKFVDDMLPKKYNELSMILKTYGDSSDAKPEQCLVSRNVFDVLRIRKIIFTNKPFPEHSFRQSGHIYASKAEFEATSELVCRWRYTEETESTGTKVISTSLRCLTEDESDYGMSDVSLRKKWRGEEMPSPILSTNVKLELATGRNTPNVASSQDRNKAKGTADNAIEIPSSDDEDDELPSFPIRRGWVPHLTRVYTFGDLCCGAGGVTSGASRAGFKVSFMLDHDKDAVDTARANSIPGVKVLEWSIFYFCVSAAVSDTMSSYIRVDVLHISFPCQPHSPAHTIDGRNDDANIATSYSAIEILQLCRPRIVTFEQTFGIVKRNGGYHFRALIHQITSAGYSCRWKIINMAEYGNVQARKRLIVIASCPGQELPHFPAPTHGPGLRPFTTIADCLIRARGPCEGVMGQFTYKSGIPYDANQPLRHAITCSGGEGDLHPCGWRSFTLQELAVLAGFPPSHRFRGTKTSIRRQIGNAVPSVCAHQLYKTIKECLEESDRKAAS